MARWASAREPVFSVNSELEFRALEPIWRDLYARATNASPFRSWEFAVEWFRQFVLGRVGGATGRFEILVARDKSGRAIGLLPMFEERTMGADGTGLTLQPFGRTHSFEAMTDEPISLVRSGWEAEAMRLLSEHLARRMARDNWDIAVIPGEWSGGATGWRSLRCSRRLDAAVVTRHSSAPLWLELPRSWEAFLTSLTKSMRDNIAYYPRRLTREIGSWSLDIARSPREVLAAAEQLVELHRRRARSATGTPHMNHLVGETEASFIRRWFRRAAALGGVSIGTIQAKGEVVAAQAFVEVPGCVSVYYSGYDERFYRYSPLTVITAHLLRDAIARGVSRVEFPPGQALWKSRWGAVDGPARTEVSLYAVRAPALLRGLSRRLRLRAAPV
jgi:CelD/BcsL family acetyltransferase involved in cellulose biosynthesis